MANCSEDQCEDLVTKLRNVSGTELTSLLDHFDKSLGANFKPSTNFKFFKTWLTEEYTSFSQVFSPYEAIESYLRIKEIQVTLSDFECSLIKKMDRVEQFLCPECGSQIKLNPEESLWNTLQAHRIECAKLIDELISKNQASSSSSAGTSTSASLHDASTSQSEKDFDERSVNATEKAKKTDEMLQSLILLEDNSSTWCVQCAVKVPYREVKQHLSQKCHQLPSQLGGGASKKIVNYDDSVLKALYNGDLYNYTVLIDGVHFFIIQNLGAFKHCIICIENISDIKNHTKLKGHKKLAKQEDVQKLLKLYHDTWVCQPLHVQIQQKYFRKHEAGMICILCRDTVAYTNQALRLHLESSQHRLCTLKSTTLNQAEFEYGARTNKLDRKLEYKATSDNIIDIISKSEHNLYPPAIMEQVYAGDQSKLYTVQLKSSRTLRCLLCRTEFCFKQIPELLHHIRKRPHKNKVSKTNRMSYMALNSYHDYWKGNEKYSFMQEDFWPVTDAITWCIQCGINLEYKYVYTHIEKYHVEDAKDVDLSGLLHEDFKCAPSIYETNLLKKIYPANIPQFNIIKDMKSYPLIHTLKNAKKCLLCACLFKEDVLMHLTSKKHIKNANHKNFLSIFKKYHETWISEQLESVKEEQVYFLPEKNRMNICILCSCTIGRKQVLSHIETEQHKANVSTYAPSSTYPTGLLAQNVFPLKATTTEINKKHKTELKGPLTPVKSTGIVHSYDPIVESLLYPESLAKLAQELSGNNILTIRLQSDAHFYCLLCFQSQTKFLMKSEVHAHIAEERHLKKYTNALMLSTLEAYHNYWMQSPLQNQILQVDFTPVAITKCRCLKCKCLLKYENLEKHLKIKEHSGLASDQNQFSSLIVSASSADLENSILWKSVSDNARKVSSNTIANMTSQMNAHNDISETAHIFELNEMSQSNSMSNSYDYEDDDDDTVSESESDSVVSFRDTTDSDPSELNGHHSDSRDLKRPEDDFQLKFLTKYDKLVEDTLYPDLQMGCVEIDGIQYPVFRILENEGVVCTICKGNPKIQSITNHLESKGKHFRRMNDANVLSRLRRFHLFWMSQEASAQLLQKYFKTTESVGNLKCYLCQTILIYENCIEHVKVFHHVTSENENEKRDNESITFQVVNEASDSSSLSPATVSGLYENMSEKYKVPDFNFQFKFEMKYDKSVEDVLYPAELRKHFVSIDNINYPIFRVKSNGFECLICNNFYNPAFISIEDHLNSPVHDSESQVQFTLTRLVIFHDFWMNQEPNTQLQQKYFGILDKALKCILCDLTVTYEEVTAHVELPQHKKSADLKKQESTQTPSISKQDSQKSSPKPAAKATPTSKTKQEHKTRKAVSNPNSSVLLERMPERYKSHLHFLKTNAEGSISCICCSVPLKYELVNLKLHLKTKDHIENSKTPLTKFKFLCEICVKIYSSEDSWEKHLKEKEHLGVLNNLGKGRKGNMLEHECVTCSLVIFGDKLSLMRHQQWNKVSSKRKKELKLPESVRRLFESNQHIEEAANQLVMEANRESQDQEKEKECCLALVSVLKEIYPQCRAFPFGSRVIGLGSRDSDLDIFVDVDDMYTGNKMQSAEEQAIIVMEVKKILRKSKPIFSDINPVPTARTPIIQVFHVPTKIDCDVSFRHGLSVENTAFIRLCIDLQPVIQGVLLVLKQWCKMCDLNNFSSYALTMMAIFYFQTQGYLLTVKELRAINSNASAIIDGWETIKFTASLSTMKSYLKLCNLSVKDLLHDFFDYFARYDYEKQVMCPLLGQSILKTCFNDNGVNLPPEMKSYIQKIMLPDAELFRNRSPMCIQDPFDLLHNLTKACERSFLTKWKTYCDLSAKHLSALH